MWRCFKWYSAQDRTGHLLRVTPETPQMTVIYQAALYRWRWKAATNKISSYRGRVLPRGPLLRNRDGSCRYGTFAECYYWYNGHILPSSRVMHIFKLILSPKILADLHILHELWPEKYSPTYSAIRRASLEWRGKPVYSPNVRNGYPYV